MTVITLNANAVILSFKKIYKVHFRFYGHFVDLLDKSCNLHLGLYPGNLRISSVIGNGRSSVGKFLLLSFELLSSCSRSQMSLSTELIRAVKLMSTVPAEVAIA